MRAKYWMVFDDGEPMLRTLSVRRDWAVVRYCEIRGANWSEDHVRHNLSCEKVNITKDRNL